MITMSTAPTPPRLLHFHIFKNGGSTLDWILRRNFGDAFREVHGPNAESTLVEEDIELILKEDPSSIAFSSHHFRFPIDRLLRVFPIVLLRHPLDRVASIFEQERRAGLVDSYTGLADWVHRCLEERPYVLCDTQTSFLARGGVYYEPPNEIDLSTARTRIEAFDFVGVVDEYDASMVSLEHQLRPWWPDFDARYFPQNRSDRDPSLGARLAILEKLLGDELFRRLERNNLYDAQLVEYARSKLHQKLEETAGAHAAIEDFAARCATLR